MTATMPTADKVCLEVEGDVESQMYSASSDQENPQCMRSRISATSGGDLDELENSLIDMQKVSF